MGRQRRYRAVPRLAAITIVAALGVTLPLAVRAHAATPRAMFAVVPDGTSLKVIRFSSGDPDAARALAANPAGGFGGVVSPDEPMHALGSADPLEPEQWALKAVDFQDAWPTTRGSGVTVAVVDTGVLGNHEDLAGSVLQGIDFVSPGGNGWADGSGHGTHVAGVIAAHVGNGRGIAGAAPGVKILPVRVLDSSGSGSTSTVAEGIIYAADHGARVVNLSLGGDVAVPALELAVQYAVSKGAVVVAAAGNSGQQNGTHDSPAIYPGAFPETIAVGAVGPDGSRASFSNVGSYVDVVAPGVDVLSTYNSSTHAYAWGSGTSMATPYASAEAALFVAAHPGISVADVRHEMESTARDLGAPGRDHLYGNGLIAPRGLNIPQHRGNEGTGYWVAASNGAVKAFGSARWYGDMLHRTSSPIVASARTPSGHGYWLTAADGSVYAFGDAHFFGSMHGRALNGPIVGMAATPSGDGYYLLGRDGGIFTFGDAVFHGSTGGRRLNAPVLDMTATPSGHGYWMVAADGGIFTFGDATFHGSTGRLHLNAPARSMTAADSGSGYWIVASDGGIFTFGVSFAGSVPALGVPPIAGARIRAMPSGRGYVVLSREGGVYTFGTAAFFGSFALPAGTAAVDLMTIP